MTGGKGTYDKYLQKIYHYFLFHTIYHHVMRRSQEFIPKELENFTKIVISIVFY